MEPVITSTSNPLIRRFKRLHRSRGRREASQTIIEGPTLLASALAARVVPVAVLLLEGDEESLDVSDLNSEVRVVSASVLRAAAESVNPQSPVAIIEIPLPGSIRGRDTLVISDVSDPGNVGTMIRSAAAFGWDVCVVGRTSDPWSPKVLRSGVGTHFGVHIARTENLLDDVCSAGLELIATVVEGGGEPLKGDKPVALLVGSESHGLSEDVREGADREITLSMPGGTESLNAAVAASIFMQIFTEKS